MYGEGMSIRGIACREANTATDRAYRVRRAIRDSAAVGSTTARP
jgi:hypothetical protein